MILIPQVLDVVANDNVNYKHIELKFQLIAFVQMKDEFSLVKLKLIHLSFCNSLYLNFSGG